MEVFHIDRKKSLASGQQISLHKPNSPNQRFQTYMNTNFPDGISYAGDVFLADVSFHDIQSLNHRVKEIEFESIRRLYFPEKPSRFQCFFALESLDDVQIWARAFNINRVKNPYAVWKISVDNESAITKLDASWRDRDYKSNKVSIYSAWENHMDGHAYWRGEDSDDPRKELLIPLSHFVVKVIELVEHYTMQ